MFCHDFQLRYRKSRQNGSDVFLYHRLNPWNVKTIIPQVKPVECQIQGCFATDVRNYGKTIIQQVKPVEWQNHYSTG